MSSQLDRLCNRIEADIDVMRASRHATSVTTGWDDRIVRREESWEETRPKIFKEAISKEGYPASEVFMCYVD